MLLFLSIEWGGGWRLEVGGVCRQGAKQNFAHN